MVLSSTKRGESRAIRNAPNILTRCNRLQVNIAKIQQSLPEQKRDGSTILNSVYADVIFADNSTTKAGTVLAQVDFLQKLGELLQESPEKVISDFEEIRKHCKSLLHCGVACSLTFLQ